MAELLIKARDATHSDPETDRRGCYKRGDIVVVMPDGHTWGAKEGLPNFVVLKIPGVDPDRIRALTGFQDEDDAGVPQVEDDGVTPRMFRRRRWRLLVSSLPAAVRDALLTDGEFTAAPSQVRNYVRRVRDNLQYPDL